MELFLNFILWILAAVGLNHILAEASILTPLKLWLQSKGWLGEKTVQMMNCYQCNGFWSGLIVYLLTLIAPYSNFLFWAFAISLIGPFLAYIKMWAYMLTAVNFEPMEQEPNEDA